MERSGSIAESSTAPDTRKLAGVRVLAMDDDRDTREMLRVVLNQYGADVATAASARQAMDVVSGWKPDVLVCDISMNGEDGFQFMENFRKLGPEKGGSAPAIALTAHVESETRERALGAGYHTLVPKPMDSQELVAVIAELTGRAGQSAAANC
jgi:CheY-like chemotaxis protein